MAKVVVTFRIMPESPDIDLAAIKTAASAMIDEAVGAGDRKDEIIPIAYGLKSLNLTFVMDESKGSPDPLADRICGIDGVNSCEVTDVRRSIG
ncbi:MAG: elongation factor 1-beta [Nanoarchaeota archaeon]